MSWIQGATVATPEGRPFSQGQFGKYSSVEQVPGGDPNLYAATRLRGDKTSDNDYETAQYKLVTGPDGKQSLQQIGSSWAPVHQDSGMASALAMFLAAATGGAALAGGFGGLGAAGAAAGEAGAGALGANGAFLGEGIASGIGAWDAAAGLSAAEAGALGANGAFLGEGFASGIPAWDTAAGFGAAETGALGANGAFLGEGVPSGVPAWDTAAGFGAETTAGLGSAGLSSADKAALYGPEGYGPGMTGAQTGAYDAVVGATGSKGLADLAAGAANVPGVGKLIQNGTSAVGNWWDRFTDLDPTAWQQGLGALGALNSLFGGGGGQQSGGPQLPGGTLGGFGANNDWTAAQKPQVSSFFDRPAQPRVWAPRPQGYAEGGGVMSMMAEEDGMMAPEEGMAPFGSQAQSFVEGPGGGQDDRVDASLSPGEYVFDADVVSALGDGSNEEGARRLDEMRELIRQRSRSAPPDQIPPKALPPAGYLQQVMQR